MDTHLSERLRDAAEDAPRARPEPDLWARGRRFHRRRRLLTGAVVTAAVMLLATTIGVNWNQQAVVLPAESEQRPALPTRLHAPSQWLPGTDSAGPLGHIAVVWETERGGWFGSRQDLVGVSASTGEYRFLDLPDRVENQEWALAPNGRHVAYWLTGETQRDPHREAGAIVGVAVYDSESGEVRRYLPPTDHGLSPDVLIWTSPRTLVLGFSQFTAGVDASDEEQGQATGGLRMIWEVDTTEPRQVAEPGGGNAVGLPDGRLAEYSGRRLSLTDPSADSPPLRLRLDRSVFGGLSLGQDGRRLALLGGSSNPGPIWVGEVPETEGGRVVTARVPDSGRTWRVLGWIDDDRIAVTRRLSFERDGEILGLMDVESGETETVTTFSWPVAANAQYDVELLGVAPIERPAPPTPWGPPAVLTLVLLIAGGAGWALWAVRRRVRP